LHFSEVSRKEFREILGDLDLQREDQARLAGKKFQHTIEPPYCWRDGATQRNGITGDELLACTYHEACTLPNGNRGSGFFVCPGGFV
jgi:type I restriction enzyme M protein